jgi:hypothetical protein
MTSHDIPTTFKHRFIDFRKVVFYEKADYVYTLPFLYLNDNIRQLINITFLNAQNEENAFKWPYDIMKH